MRNKQTWPLPRLFVVLCYNTDMGRNVLFALILVFTGLGAIYFWVGVPKVYREKFPDKPKLHLYKNPGQSIVEIKAAVFYFLPANKAVPFAENWGEIIENNLEKLKRFHSAQFLGLSKFEYEVYPEPVIGEMDNIVYDTDVTQHGNPEALRSIALEIEGRIFDANGDLFKRDFLADCRLFGGELKSQSGAYCAIIIIYEGVGAAGSENAALLSRIFLSDSQYESIAPTLLAHEFYHTLGIPDAYDIPNAIPFSEDIMGLGRFKPIDKSYISKDSLVQLGL